MDTSDDLPRRRRRGLLCLALGLLLNEWVVGRLVARDGSIDDAAFRAAVWLLDGVLVASGVVLLVRRKPLDRRKLLFSALAAVLVLVVTEGVLHAARYALQRGVDPVDAKHGRRHLLSPYKDTDWGRQLFTELDDDVVGRHFVYDPFLGWDMRPYDGETIHTDERGARVTWNPPGPQDGDPSTLYVFGGSTTWGMGARDEHTLPSYISKALAREGHPFHVSNYGDLAFGFTQEVVHLIFLLKQGHRPDYVLFYDGVNDVYGAYGSGVPGDVLDPLAARVLLGRTTTPLEHVQIGVQGLLDRYSLVYQGLTRLPELFANAPSGPAFHEVGAGLDEAALAELAHGIVDNYASTHELLGHLAVAYGFRHLTFWQPVTFTEHELLEEERRSPRTADRSLGRLHQLALDFVRERDLPRFHDVSAALAGRQQTYYIDYCHLSEAGNEAVGERLADIFAHTFLDAD